LREERPLNEPDASTFFGGGETGYTDYPPIAA
jgi:N-ethylmaleimide reductase